VALGILVALWSAGAGVRALITALNIAYREAEERGFITLYASGFLLTVGLIGAAVLALIVIVAVPVVLHFLPLGSLSSALIRVLTWLVMAAIVIAGLGVLYRYGPSRSHARLPWVTWGAIAAAILWLVASLLFQVYVANFANYSATYGSLGAVIALTNVVLDFGLRRPARGRAQCRDGAPDPQGHHHRSGEAPWSARRVRRRPRR
jgi:membrane protein